MVNDVRRARGRHSRENRDKFGGGGARSYIVEIPGVEAEDWYSVKRPQKNEIDIIEFKITQDWYPKLRCRTGGTCGDLGLVPGELDYKLEVPAHQGVGPLKKNHVCPYDAFGDPCPICEDKFALLEANNNVWNRDTMQHLLASWRCFYNIYDYAESRFRPWQVAYNTWEKKMQEALDAYKEETGNEIFPWAWDEGWGMEFLATKKNMGGGNSYNEPQLPTFFQRDPYTMDDVEGLWSFDKYLKLSTYEEIAADYHGQNKVETLATSYADQKPDKPTTRTRSRSRMETELEPEEPTTRIRQPAKKDAPWDADACSYGHVYGKDLNQTPDCQSCTEEEFEKCLAIKEGKNQPKEESTNRKRQTTKTEEPKTTTRRRRGN